MISVWTLPTSSSGESADGSTSQQQLSALQTAHLTRLVSPRYANQRVQVKTALAMTISPACGMCVWWALWSVFFCREARPTNVCDHFRGFGSILCAGTIFWSDTGCFHTVAESPLALTALELRLPALKKKDTPWLVGMYTGTRQRSTPWWTSERSRRGRRGRPATAYPSILRTYIHARGVPPSRGWGWGGGHQCYRFPPTIKLWVHCLKRGDEVGAGETRPCCITRVQNRDLTKVQPQQLTLWFTCVQMEGVGDCCGRIGSATRETPSWASTARPGRGY